MAGWEEAVEPQSSRIVIQFPCNPSCTLSGMPSRSVTWSAGSSILPPGFVHVSGHCYEWGVVIMDNWRYGKEGRATHTFCVP